MFVVSFSTEPVNMRFCFVLLEPCYDRSCVSELNHASLASIATEKLPNGSDVVVLNMHSPDKTDHRGKCIVLCFFLYASSVSVVR